MSNTTKRIRQLIDRFRTTLTDGKADLTAGVAALSDDAKARALHQVVTFTDFTTDNDPYQEHDFGAFELDGQRLFWKVDYFDRRDPNLGVENPSDEARTERVLTLMLAEEV